MPEQWVLYASPLILLAKVGQEGLFAALSDRFVVPRSVATEIEAGPANVLELLRDSGFRIDDKVVGDALRSTVGEKWPL